MRRFLPKSQFARHVLTLVTGTGVAQLLPILASPILSRQYSREDFNVLGLFMAISMVLSPLATGKYELAILLPEDDADGASLVGVVLAITLTVCVLAFAVLVPLAGPISRMLGNPRLAHVLWLVPFSLFGLGTFQAFNYWFNRSKKYGRLARARMSRSGVSVAGMLGFGAAKVDTGLALGTAVGNIAAGCVMAWQAAAEDGGMRKYVTVARLKALAKRYARFPAFSVPADTVNNLSSQMPVFLLTAFFGPAIAGSYSFTQRILASPSSIVSQAFSDVYKQRASEEIRAHGHCRTAFKSTFRRLTLISLTPFLIVGLFGAPLFAFVFGSTWREAGLMAQVLTPYVFLAFTVSPLASTLYVAEKQHWDLMWQVGLLLVNLTTLNLGRTIGKPLESVALFMAGYSLMYLVYFGLSMRAAGFRSPLELFRGGGSSPD
ncbi:MAG: oligosaccharide flippase family protein [Fimbriimonadaceae bacterium]|nr:oligosaccharide flippase family protein [Fimbriimonadaceae bacterium]